MNSLLRSIVVAASILAITSVSTGLAETHARAGGLAQQRDTVIVTQFVPSLRVGNQGLYRVSFRYDFPQGTRVFLAEYGELPNRGSLSFLTPARALVFRDEQGRVLRQVNLNVTSAPEGAGSKMPAPEDFPPEYQSFTRAGPLPSELCDATLNRFFAAGYRPRTEGNLTYYVTAYQPLTGILSTKYAEVSLQVSAPYTIAGNAAQSAFRVQMLVRERGKLSTTWAEQITPQTMTAANALRAQVVDLLNN
jgi:hypothetical protein